MTDPAAREHEHDEGEVMTDEEIARTAPEPAARCCGGTGYADYAAVPCPNPECPVDPTARETQTTCWHPACIRGEHRVTRAHESDLGETWVEQPAPTAREIPAGEQGCQETNTATEGVSHNRDMADTREIPADELAEAERYVRRVADENDDGDLLAVLRFLAEALRTELGRLDRMYDERGRERDAARAEVERLRKENARLKQYVERPWTFDPDYERRVAALDALARAHEAQDGGRDR